jgi:hypothetical protein
MSSCAWLVTTFDSEEQDPSDYLKAEYGGLMLHIKPGHRDAVSVISTFLEDGRRATDARIIINRFLSAMAWKDNKAFVSLGAIAGGARLSDRDKPRFNLSEGRVLRYGVINRFDFEHLQDPPEEKQKLGLALYREGLNSTVNQFYRFLSFFKILNIRFPTGAGQVNWINANLGKVWDYLAQERLAELGKTEADIGEYLWKEGRNAIAHAYSDPILDPDMPDDRAVARVNAELMQGIAQAFIEAELGVPSLRKIWSEHLYELKGFRSMFGDTLSARLKNKESVPLADFPQINPLTLALKEHPRFDCLTGLSFRVITCKNGTVLLGTDPTIQPMAVALALDFPAEKLELVPQMFGVNFKQEKYTKSIGASYYSFLIGYFCNGCLQVLDASTGERLALKDAFIPINLDLHATVDGWRKKIAELEAG